MQYVLYTRNAYNNNEEAAYSIIVLYTKKLSRKQLIWLNFEEIWGYKATDSADYVCIG